MGDRGQEIIEQAGEYYAIALAAVIDEDKTKSYNFKSASRKFAILYTIGVLPANQLKTNADEDSKQQPLIAMQRLLSSSRELEIKDSDILLSNPRIFAEALRFLELRGAIIVYRDAFAPTYFSASPTFSEVVKSWGSGESSALRKFNQIGIDRITWLRGAIANINNQLRQQPEQSNEATAPNATNALAGPNEAQWSPLPLDRKEPSFNKAVDQLVDAIEAIRTDNGYAATYPDERNEVVFALEGGLRMLRENAALRITYLRYFIIEPLNDAIKRLKDSASGVAATIAQGAIIKWAADSIGQNLPEWLGTLIKTFK